jgi:hypothetical protein
MKRADLEHILRASKGITGESEFIVIGSQSILAKFPDAPRGLRQSMEVDLYPRFKPELAAEIEGSLGELSQFHQTYRYHADGVSPDTAILPTGWDSRLISLSNENTGGAIGWCLEPHDLAFSKLAAGREKDLTFVATLLHFKMIRPTKLKALIQSVPEVGLRERLLEILALAKKKSPSDPTA